MSDTHIAVPALHYAATLDIARLAVNHAAKRQHIDEFALTGEGTLLFHGQEIPHDVLWTIPTEHKRAVLEHFIDAAHIELDMLLHDEDEVAA